MGTAENGLVEKLLAQETNRKSRCRKSAESGPEQDTQKWRLPETIMLLETATTQSLGVYK